MPIKPINSKTDQIMDSNAVEETINISQIKPKSKKLSKRIMRFGTLTIFLIITVIISSVFTFYRISESTNPLGASPQEVLPMILINLTLLLLLVSIISWRISKLWIARRAGSVGSRLQIRIIVMFSLVSIVPTIIVAVFSAVFFNQGIQTWFDKKVNTALNESVEVSRDFIREKKDNIRADILAMAIDLNKQANYLSKNQKRLNQVLWYQTVARGLSEVVVFQHNKLLQNNKVLGKGAFSFSILFELDGLPGDVFKSADKGEVVVLENNYDDRVRSLIRLSRFKDTYLLVGRIIDPKTMNRIKLAQDSYKEYQVLHSNISKLQIQFALVFVLVAIMLLLVAIWVGMIFAGEISNPIGKLLDATDKVKKGDLDTVINENGPKHDEIAILARAFNRMTKQLKLQRDELVDGHKEMDSRRRMIEAVFSGVSVGVIALNNKREITIFNRVSLNLLGKEEDEIRNIHIKNIIPQAEELINNGSKFVDGVIQDEIQITRNERKFSCLIRIVPEEFIDKIEGYIVTLDDVTELKNAQRTAAWSDVARRIAHEIKNPLTPIHLSAERLKRKYLKEIKSDPETFEKYINTISKHVDNIGKIVEEFSNFARMPTPKLKKMDIFSLINDSIFSEQVVNSDINYVMNCDKEDIFINGDAGLLTQVFTNLLKNSKESLQNKADLSGELNKKIEITINVTDYVNIEIADNGTGFPTDLIDNVTEPYVTTRERGTGLGLAVAKKIIIEHDGSFDVSNIGDEEIKGAKIDMIFPLLIS